MSVDEWLSWCGVDLGEDDCTEMREAIARMLDGGKMTVDDLQHATTGALYADCWAKQRQQGRMGVADIFGDLVVAWTLSLAGRRHRIQAERAARLGYDA